MLRSNQGWPLRSASTDSSIHHSARPLKTKVKELTLVTTLACLYLALAWAHEADYSAMVFAVEAAFAGMRT
jgi:hypothetical protein